MRSYFYGFNIKSLIRNSIVRPHLWSEKMAHPDHKIEQETDVSDFNQELKINDADHHLLMDLIQNPRPANDEMNKLMALSKEII